MRPPIGADGWPVLSGSRPLVGKVVLVTDADQRAALAVVRSLGRAGCRVFVGSSQQRSLAGASRYCAGHITLPDPLLAPNEFAAAVVRAVAMHSITIVLPVTEAAALAILEHRSKLEGCLVPLPPAETFHRVCDKAHVLEKARGLGIAVPGQVVLAHRDEAVPSTVPPFPLVLKPSRSVVPTDGARHKLQVRHVSDRREMDAALAALPPAAYPLMLQQRVVGPGVGIFLLIWDGSLRAVFAHRRLREKPPSGGVSVYRESIAADPGLVERSRALLDRLDWQGVAMVEYKLDAQTGTPYLMEINGRFWGSLQLAIDAGVDFPRLVVEAAIGERSAGPPAWTPGVRSRWWWGDVDHLLAMFRHSRRELALPPDHPGRWRTLTDFLTPRSANRNETLQLDDPTPFIVETLDWCRFW